MHQALSRMNWLNQRLWPELITMGIWLNYLSSLAVMTQTVTQTSCVGFTIIFGLLNNRTQECNARSEAR